MSRRVVINRKTSREELAAVIYRALNEALDDRPVLVGGSVATIYSRGRYQSYDLDIVTWRDDRRIKPVMEQLGFVQDGNYWSHPKTELFVQFVSPPVMVGEKHIRRPTKLATPVGEVLTLSPLESACDRLGWYLSGDAPSLEQCADVVFEQKLSLASIGKWLKGELYPEQLKQSALHALRNKVALRRKRAAKE